MKAYVHVDLIERAQEIITSFDNISLRKHYFFISDSFHTNKFSETGFYTCNYHITCIKNYRLFPAKQL